MRIDKLTLAALEATLRLYRDPEKAVQTIPTLSMLTIPVSVMAAKAEKLCAMLDELKEDRLEAGVRDITSRVGGGALPIMDLPSKGVGIEVRGMSANAIEKRMRIADRPVIGRIEDDVFVMDLRTVAEDELAVVSDAIRNILMD